MKNNSMEKYKMQGKLQKQNMKFIKKNIIDWFKETVEHDIKRNQENVKTMA